MENTMREDILRIARAYFSAKAYSSVNLADIAAEAHVTRAPLYYYFKNKEGLYRAVVAQTLAEAQKHCEEIFSADMPVFDIIRTDYRYCVSTIGNFQRIWNQNDAPDCSQEVRAFKQWLIDRKTSEFTAAQARGELDAHCSIPELVTFIYIYYFGIISTAEMAVHQKGFDEKILKDSEQYFIELLRSRYAPKG
ncbi:MAG: TetR/AcrR family transcriptional regulator [Clostridia bacterium]|nr:TetR/AcrR family transcriptional regulator [Clostridia bacterium]